VHFLSCRYVEEFFREPYRGYGRNVAAVFEALKEEKCHDPFGPGQKQFDGAGSRGNGGAMRISPAALFAVNQQSEEVDVIAVSHTFFSELIFHIFYSVYVCFCLSM